MRSVFLAVLAVTAFVGCSNIRGEVLTSSNKDQVTTEIGKSNLSEEDKRAYVAAAMRSSLGNYSLEGKTVGDVITEQKAWQAKQDAEAAAAHEQQLAIEAKRAALVMQMEHTLSVQPLSKRFEDSDYEAERFDQTQFVTFQFHNTGSKAITGIKGTVTFTNSFGDKVISLELEDGGSSKHGIPAGQIATAEFNWKYNPYEDDWKTFRSTELSALKAQWIPDEIIYSDGSTLKAPDPE